MGSVSISVSPIPPNEFSKKKKSNRLAKLKQSKLDVRRQQWLSQVNTKDFKTESNDKGRSPPTVFGPIQCNKTMDRDNRQTSPDRDDEDKRSSMHDENLNYLLCSTNHDASEYKESSSPPQLTSNSSSSSSCWSINFSEEDDDWEAMADALPALEEKKLGPTENPLAENEVRGTSSPVALQTPSTHSMTETKKITDKPLIIRQAWSANDFLRPQSLPHLSSKISLLKDSEFSSSHDTSCPICCEDLDLTDSSFQPCKCGFSLCLFCHNRILEEDSRCPGCRKKYNC